MKVISYMDADGYIVVIDVSYPRDRIVVFRDLFLEALEIENIDLKTPEVQQLLSKSQQVQQTGNENDIDQVVNEIIDYLDEIDFPCAGFGRNGIQVITPGRSWVKGGME